MRQGRKRERKRQGGERERSPNRAEDGIVLLRRQNPRVGLTLSRAGQSGARVALVPEVSQAVGSTENIGEPKEVLLGALLSMLRSTVQTGASN